MNKYGLLLLALFAITLIIWKSLNLESEVFLGLAYLCGILSLAGVVCGYMSRSPIFASLGILLNASLVGYSINFLLAG